MTNKDLEDKIKTWWWSTNGTGTSACPDCRKQTICTWHTARLDDLTALISQLENEARKVTGETSDGKSIQPLLVQFIGDAKANVQD